MKDKKVLISLCLLGAPCRYDGQGQKISLPKIENIHFIPLCPEQLGGLATPRKPAEIKNGQVFTEDGDQVTPAFIKGAQACLDLAQDLQISHALLKSKSPSCGKYQVYDGTFSGQLLAGQGITAAKLEQAGIKIYNEWEVEDLIKDLQNS